jgi:hypothetical protein
MKSVNAQEQVISSVDYEGTQVLTKEKEQRKSETIRKYSNAGYR